MHSLTEAAQLAQKQVGILARVMHVAHDGLAANLAGVIYNHVTVTQKPLHDRGRHRHVLNVAQREIARCPREESFVDLHLVISQRVLNHVALEMVEGRDQQERQRNGKRNPPGRTDDGSQQDDYQNRAERGQAVTDLDKKERRARLENLPLNIIRSLLAHGGIRRRSSGSGLHRGHVGLRCWLRASGIARHFRVNGGRAAASAEARTRSYVSSTVCAVHNFSVTSFDASGQAKAGEQFCRVIGGLEHTSRTKLKRFAARAFVIH